MRVQEAIFAFDGRAVGDLKAALVTFEESEAADVVALCSSGDPLHRVAATWVVKALLEVGRGQGLDVPNVMARLDVEDAPDAVLHLLQSVQFDPAAARGHLAAIRGHLSARKTFVAVWALDAWVRVALETSEDLQEARSAVEHALEHEKASMRARARHLAPLLGL